MASWQADVVSTFIRMIVKRRPEGSEADVVNHIRSSLELSQLIRSLIAPVDLRAVSAVKDGSVKGEWLRFNGEPRQTIYYLHGGAYVACSPETHRAFTSALSRAANASVFALDYRLAPEHRFPAAVEDAVAGYRWLLDQGVDPQEIVIGGDSAGGGLTMATLLALRDAGERLPRAAFLMSPWVDLAYAGRSLDANDERDSDVLRRRRSMDGPDLPGRRFAARSACLAYLRRSFKTAPAADPSQRHRGAAG